MATLEDYKFKDRLIRGISPHGDFKIHVVKTTEVVREAIDRHGLSLLSATLLGRTLTAAALLAAELKGEERVVVKLEGTGPVGFVIAEANHVGEIRGYVKNPQAQLPEGATSLGEGLGTGLLTITKILYNEAEPRSSVIELISGDVRMDLAYYLAQSEQIPSAVLLDEQLDESGAFTQTGGILIQRLPGANPSVIDTLQDHLASFGSVSEKLSAGSYIDEIMKEACGAFPVKELDRIPVHFFCRCSRERFLNGLSMLTLSDLEEMEGESQELVCHYCNRREIVSVEEIGDLVVKARAATN